MLYLDTSSENINYIGNLHFQKIQIDKVLYLIENFKYKDTLNINNFVKSLNQHKNQINHNIKKGLKKPLDYHTDRLKNNLQSKINNEFRQLSFFIPVDSNSPVKISRKRTHSLCIKSGCLKYVALNIRYNFYTKLLNVFNNNWDYILNAYY